MERNPDPANDLREFLRGRDIRCPICKYNLRDLTSAVCPECGEALTLRLQAEHPRVAVLVLGLLPLAMSLGFFGIVTLFIMAISLWEGDWPPVEYWIAAPIAGLVFGLATFTWLRLWTRVRRLNWWRCMAAILTCWVLMAAGSTVFLLIIMNF